MKQKQKLQALFFDFDGVIVDSNSTKTAAFRALFKDYKEQVIAEIVAYHRRHGGISRVEKIRYAHQHIIKQPLTDKRTWPNGQPDIRNWWWKKSSVSTGLPGPRSSWTATRVCADVCYFRYPGG